MKSIKLIRYDDGEFWLLVNGNIVGDVLTNHQARLIRKQLEAGLIEDILPSIKEG